MLNKELTDKLKALVKNTDIGVTVANDGEVIYLLPYDKDTKLMTLEGTTEEEKIASFIEQINSGLDTMISHLNDCKIQADQTGKYTTYPVFCG